MSTTKRGRPAKPANEHAVRVIVSISQDQLAWLKAQPIGVSRTIRELIEAKRK